MQFNVTSVDVTHGFWPAALGVQVDANPNVVTVIRTTPNALGSFIVQCSQLCGLYHAFMNNNGDVVTTQQFDSWLQSNGATPTAAGRGGRRVVRRLDHGDGEVGVDAMRSSDRLSGRSTERVRT